MNETLQNLAQQEQELRIQAGLNPPKEDKAEDAEELTDEETSPTDEEIDTLNEESAPTDEQTTATEDESEQNGNRTIGVVNSAQGGSVQELDIADVAEELYMIEQRVNTRRESLNDFQTELKNRREQMAIGAAVANGYTPGSSAPSPGFVQFDFSGGLPIIPAAGSIPAPGSFPFDPSLIGGTGATDSNIPSIWPTTGIVTSPYGLRWDGTDFHPGMDIADEMGTPIVATADGVVEYAGWNSGGYGNMVDINHGNGMMTRYGHASQVVVSTGQHVKRGQLIAYMGSTGFSTGPHLHYEVHVNGNRVNPISYL
ncbi:MAG: peptidoglycan DD-metalloendopeptidase family protein [Selenomonadaceae bacterium]|nr:peptidoglycan DD-metalloendopeptidase family protein [Selenomonadaceae bacterium]